MKACWFMAALVLLASVGLLAWQRRGAAGWLEQDGPEDSLPTNSGAKVEWTFARFHYPRAGGESIGFRGFQRWAADYPKSDRQFVMGVERLTRIHTRPQEQVVEADSDDIYNWPWIFVEDAGWWSLDDAQVLRLRQYLLRGGFLMLDDTHGDREWAPMEAGLRRILPDRPIEELKDQDEIFHVLYDLNERFQIPGTRFLWGRWRYTADSSVPHWRAIRDEKGRILVAICHNSDVGDAWEWADSPQYPERATSLAYRLGINYIVYAMTH